MEKAIMVAERNVSSVVEFCTPLFENTDICYFSHIEYSLNAEAICLASNKTIIRYIWENKLYPRQQDLEEFSEYRILLKETSERNKKICEHLKVDHLIRYIVKYKTYYEVNAFGSAQPLNEMIDFYLNNMDFLKLYVSYFKDKASKLLETSKKSPFMLENFNSGNVIQEIKVPCTESLKTQFEAEKLSSLNKLSPRELQCMQLLSEGKSTKEIAKIIELSPHTVQYYINNLKRKVNCRKVTEIISLYYQAMGG